MSVTTKSMVLLAAMGLAACDSSNSNSSTPTPPAVTDPETPDIAALTRANAVVNFTAGGVDGAGVDGFAESVREDRAALAEVSADFATASGLRTQITAILNTVENTDDLSLADKNTLDGFVKDLNDIVTYTLAISSADSIADLDALFEDDADLPEALARAIMSLENSLEDLDGALAGHGGAVEPALGKDIVLADGTVLSTAGIAVHTRADETVESDTILTPTATVIVAYETNGAGDVIGVRFAEAGGIGYEGAPVGTANAQGFGQSFAYLQVEGEEALRILNGRVDLELDFNQQTGQLGINASERGGEANFKSVSTLTFNRATGEFTSSTGDFSIVAEDALAVAGNNVAVSGNLQGAAEAFSGLFTVTDSRVNGEGGFAGTVVTRTPSDPIFTSEK